MNGSTAERQHQCDPVCTENLNPHAGTMPPHERLRLDDREDLQNRWKPSIQLDQEPAVVVRQPNPAWYLTPQNHQLMSERRILCFKPAHRLEWRG
jgi:hypothetical protein